MSRRPRTAFSAPPANRWPERPAGWRAYSCGDSPSLVDTEGRISHADSTHLSRALLAHACAARLGSRETRVLMAVLCRTVLQRRMRVQEPLRHISEISGLTVQIVGPVLADLRDMGFLHYESGRGRIHSVVEVVAPRGWEEVG